MDWKIYLVDWKIYSLNRSFKQFKKTFTEFFFNSWREDTPPTEALLLVLKNCANIKKLFLGCIRAITDRDLENIALHCPNLEQLDLTGIFNISTDKVEEVLERCTKLQMVDLTSCNQLEELRVALWQSAYNIRIKRSVFWLLFVR